MTTPQNKTEKEEFEKVLDSIIEKYWIEEDMSVFGMDLGKKYKFEPDIHEMEKLIIHAHRKSNIALLKEIRHRIFKEVYKEHFELQGQANKTADAGGLVLLSQEEVKVYQAEQRILIRLDSLISEYLSNLTGDSQNTKS